MQNSSVTKGKLPCKTYLEKIFLNVPYTNSYWQCYAATATPLWLSLLFRCSGYAQSLCQRKAMAATVPPIIAAGFNTLMVTCVWPVLTPDLRGHSINALWYCTVAPDGATAQ